MIVRHESHPNLRLFEHPLLAHKLGRLRDRETPSRLFRRLLNEVAALMTYEISADLPTESWNVETPLEATEVERIATPVTIVPILRAGIGMTDGILSVLSEARTGHIGVYRNEESLEPVSYYLKMPPQLADGQVLLIDPMVATGGSASFAITELKERGCVGKIKMACLVAAPPGVERLAEDHPDVPLYAAALDRQLNDVGYILPGLGDAGDRIFGTQ